MSFSVTSAKQEFAPAGHCFIIHLSGGGQCPLVRDGEPIRSLVIQTSPSLHMLIVISIYKLGDVGISSNLIGSLSLTNGHCPPPGRWIMKQWPP